MPNLKVNQIYGIGRNYGAHAKEMGNEIPEEPIVFLKPASSLLLCQDGQQDRQGVLSLPGWSQQIDYEGELVVQLKKGGVHISESDALDFIGACALGVDATARDLQSTAKKKGLPWCQAKGFSQSAIVGPWTSFDPKNCYDFQLFQNGILKQNGVISEMIYPISELISYLSKYFRLEAGDIIYTGTPSGVGPMKSGDEISMKFNQFQHGQFVLKVQ